MSITLLLGTQAVPSHADAKSRHTAHTRHGARNVAAIHAGMRTARSRHHFGHGFRIRRYGHVLQCVPFARENSGIELRGNAATWWDSADGIYQRGAKPEVGSILNFRATGHMPMGHVAVVTNVLNSRHIEIDHANWSSPGRVSRDIDVVDVSPANDWTEVRVAIGHSDDDFGGAYPTYGFIYDRPDSGTMLANSDVQEKSSFIQLKPAGILLQPTVGAFDDNSAPQEVAEAPDGPALQTTSRARTHAWHHVSSHHHHGSLGANSRVHRPGDHPATAGHRRSRS